MCCQEDDSEVAPGGARLLSQGLTDQPVPDLPSGPPLVHSSLGESLEFSQVGESSQASQSLEVSRVEKPRHKSKGRQIPNRFIQDLAWRCCQLKSTLGFESLESIDLQEEEPSPELLEPFRDLGVFLVEDVEEGILDEESSADMYVEGTRRFDEPTTAIDE